MSTNQEEIKKIRNREYAKKFYQNNREKVIQRNIETHRKKMQDHTYVYKSKYAGEKDNIIQNTTTDSEDLVHVSSDTCTEQEILEPTTNKQLLLFTADGEFKSDKEIREIHAQAQWEYIIEILNKNIGKTGPIILRKIGYIFPECKTKLEKAGYIIDDNHGK